MKKILCAATLTSMMVAWGCSSPPPPRRGVVLGDLAWPEAEPALNKDAVVVIPLAAASKEHGRHLRLDNDHVIEKWMESVVLERCDVVVAPPILYHFFPAFVDYP